MKKLAAFLALIILVMSVCTVRIGETETPENRGKVVVLATGGTIAGVGDPGKIAGYKPGTLTAEVLLWGVPEIDEVADIEVVQVCNVNSDDITAEIWLELANTINQMAEDPDVKGFVITHGTDTMEETAYFLNLTVKTDKPVVLTGAMRPATALSADGPMNLYESVCVAASAEAVGHGVLIVFSDRIYAARTMTKTSTYSVMAISAGEMGAIGVGGDGTFFLYETPSKRHTAEAEFDVTDLSALPKVSDRCCATSFRPCQSCNTFPSSCRPAPLGRSDVSSPSEHSAERASLAGLMPSTPPAKQISIIQQVFSLSSGFIFGHVTNIL